MNQIKKKELLEDTNLTNVKGVRNTIEKLIRKKKIILLLNLSLSY